jgi:DNA-binding MarR family transcriptional regulator
MSSPLKHDPVAQAHANWINHGWGEYANGMAAVTSLFRAQQILMARIDAVLRPLGLTFARFEMLTLLGFTKTGAMPLAKASTRLQVHPTSVTNTVERLGRAGLVERKPHPTDGRANLIAITPQGRDLALQAARELNREVFNDIGLPDADVETLNRMLVGLRSAAGDFSEPSPLNEVAVAAGLEPTGTGPVDADSFAATPSVRSADVDGSGPADERAGAHGAGQGSGGGRPLRRRLPGG